MRHHVRMVGFLVGMLVGAFELQSCVRDAEDCEQNGQCVNGNVTVGGGGGGVGAAGSTGTVGVCGTPCDDGNPCTDDKCESGDCKHTAVADGTPVTSSPCHACQDGNVAPAGAETLCDGTKVCDDAGTCVTCSTSQPCPSGYGCDSGGACIEGLGAECVNDTNCTAPGTVCTNYQCCLVNCTKCKRCNPVGFGSCEDVPANEYHSDCRAEDNSACDGNGTCKNDIGQPCIANTHCASGNCSGGFCAL